MDLPKKNCKARGLVWSKKTTSCSELCKLSTQEFDEESQSCVYLPEIKGV